MTYSDYYDDTSPFDEEVESFKDHLRKAVKEETQKEMETLRAANAEMAAKLKNLTTLEQAAATTKIAYERKLTMAEQTARRTVQQEGLRKLLELLDEPRYRLTRDWETGPKCGKCDENRRLNYTTPLGKKASESCECATRTPRWVVEEQTVHEVSRRGGKILVWYSPVSRYFDSDEDSIASPAILKSPEGVALEEMAKEPTYYGFTTEAAAAVLADALNKEDS